MDRATIALYVSIVAMTTAVVLAILRCYEFYQDRRPKLSILVSLSGDATIGNTITLLNASKVPANIWHFSLVWVEPQLFQRRIPLFRKVVNEESPLDNEHCDITVSPHSQYPLSFTEDDHFGWGGKMKHDIYLKIWMVGRRSPKWFWVTGTSRYSK